LNLDACEGVIGKLTCIIDFSPYYYINMLSSLIPLTELLSYSK